MAFQWTNVKAPVLKGLAVVAGLDPRSAAEQLRRRFGAKPTEDFIQEMWPALRDEWLSRDRAAAKDLTSALRARGAGTASSKPTNHEQRIAYLRSCRISKAVREEALPLFLASAGGPAVEPPVAATPAKAAAKKAPAARKTAAKKAAPAKRASAGASSSGSSAGADPTDRMRAGLRSMRPQDVPGILVMVFGISELAAMQTDDADELERRLLYTFAHVVGNANDIVPPRFAAEVAVKLRAETDHLATAALVASGAREWAESDLAELLRLFLGVAQIDVDDDDDDDDDDEPAVGVGAAAAVAVSLSTMADEMPEVDAVLELLWWSLDMHAIDVGSTADAAADDADEVDEELFDDDDEGEVHPVVAETLSVLGSEEDEFVIQSGDTLGWFASSVGPTLVRSDAPIERGDLEVTPIHVATTVQSMRPLTERQLAATLSELNRRDGVNAAAWLGDRVALRTGMVSYPQVDGWLPRYMGVAMIASAMGALHLPPELRGAPVNGVRSEPATFVAEYGGWDVGDEDADQHVMPSKADMRALFGRMPFESDTRMSGDELIVRLPGPNGRLETWLGRRRGRSDDHELVISKVTRPPWGAGVKMVLRVPSDGSAEENETLALKANVDEWHLIPNVNVWGGWSGEDDALRLTMFLPQMLFSPKNESNLIAVGNFVVYGVNRANTLAINFGLA